MSQPKNQRRRQDEPDDHAIGRSRGGLTSKTHVLVDGKGRLLTCIVSPGHAGDSPVLPALGWLTEARLRKLQGAPPYRNRPHDVLVVSTAELLAVYGYRVELSAINSGAVHPAANYARGAGTFSPIADYPWSTRRTRAPSEPIVELTVPYAIPDIKAFVIDVMAAEPSRSTSAS